jgi:hypothetical protein
VPLRASLSTAFNTKRKLVSTITDDDLEIFRRGRTNANWITNHYIRTPTSGTYWRNRSTDDQSYDPDRQRSWEIMRQSWAKVGRPDDLFPFGPDPASPVSYIVQWDQDDEPVFFHNHGWLFQPWQLQAHHSVQPDVTIIGGFGVGKTAYIAMSAAVLAATIPYCRIFAVAPQLIQANEVYNYLTTTLEGTPYWERFVHNVPTRPWPKFVIKNALVGTSTIEILSIEKDPEKIRTLEGDKLFLDQAEKFENLAEIQRDAGSRLRGSIRGRPRLGKMDWIANAGDNPFLWDRYDMGEYEPKNYFSINPRSVDNPYLSKHDIENLRRRVGGSTEEIEQWMDGKRPMGSGEHFNRTMVSAAVNDDLNKILEFQDSLAPGDPRKIEGFVYRKTSQLGIYHYEFPPDHKAKRDYIVISDPGSSNPPDRNSAVIGVFDVTEFPQKKMRMVAMNWIFGDGSYWPWALTYQDYVQRYKAFGRNAFDSTGVQKGFDELIFADMGLAAEGMDMAVSGKMKAINSLKFFMAKGLDRVPVCRLVEQPTHEVPAPGQQDPPGFGHDAGNGRIMGATTLLH